METRKLVGAQDLRYTYKERNVTKLVATIPGQKTDRQCFDHDHLKRLTEVWTAGSTTIDDCALDAGKTFDGPVPHWTSYGYDEIGNRRKETEHGLADVADRVRQSDNPTNGQPRLHAPVRVITTGPGAGRTDKFGYHETRSTRIRSGPASTA